MKILFLFFFQILFTNSGISQKKVQDYSEAFQLIEVWLDAQKDFDKLPGITASKRDNGELGETMIFERDGEGNVTKFKNHGNNSTKIR